jgi:crotonobetainyl-CoA:carnitine CoA-transferase CaiB-like acyl-CoA transferase
VTSATDGAPLPLAGVRVLDVTRALAGPFSTMILADLGAEVIKVEPIPDGDFIRGWGPFDRGESTYFLSTNRNKKSIALDFRSPEGPSLLRHWLAQVDVVVENFKPGVMTSMGLGYEDLRATCPQLIYASISGFGDKGPLAGLPGFDQVAQGYSGLMSVTGTAESGPVRVGVAIGDLTAGMWTAIAILAALRSREHSGLGQKVELSLLSSLVSLLSVQGQRYLSLKDVAGPTGNSHPVIAPYGVFRASDGDFSIAPATPDMWTKLCGILKLESLLADPRFVDNAGRAQHRQEIKDAIESRLQTDTRAAWMMRLQEAGIPCGPIYSIGEALEDAQVRQSDLVESVVHSRLGEIELLANPIRMSEWIGGSTRMPPPVLGEHTESILRSFQHTDDDIDRLLRQKVVLQAANDTTRGET